MSLDTSHTSLDIKTNEVLKPYTTFKIGGPARFFATARNEEEIRQAFNFWQLQNSNTGPAISGTVGQFVLGGGSNILVSDNGFDGMVFHLTSKGLSVVSEDDETVTISIAAGERWDDAVRYAVEHGWWGIENLSHIPGQAGAAVVQNIGAYGQQISDVLHSAEVLDKRKGDRTHRLVAAACGMGYRQSIFNSRMRNCYLIVGVTLKLAKHGKPSVDYPDVKAYFKARGIGRPSLSEIRQAIITIRDMKFPFPKEEKGGNAGSFFKNLLLSKVEYEVLETNIRRHFGPHELHRLEGIKNRFPTPGQIKIPTAFLLEICGLKGCVEGGARVNETQPLVLLNEGGATANDVLRLAKHIRQTIHRQTGMVIFLEPELVGFSESEIAEFLVL